MANLGNSYIFFFPPFFPLPCPLLISFLLSRTQGRGRRAKDNPNSQPTKTLVGTYTLFWRLFQMPCSFLEASSWHFTTLQPCFQWRIIFCCLSWLSELLSCMKWRSYIMMDNYMDAFVLVSGFRVRLFGSRIVTVEVGASWSSCDKLSNDDHLLSCLRFGCSIVWVLALISFIRYTNSLLLIHVGHNVINQYLFIKETNNTRRTLHMEQTDITS